MARSEPILGILPQKGANADAKRAGIDSSIPALEFLLVFILRSSFFFASAPVPFRGKNPVPASLCSLGCLLTPRSPCLLFCPLLRKHAIIGQTMISDSELLRRYCEDSADSAFAELVQRYLGLVYSAALRQVGGNSHLAEEIAQIV